MNKFALIGALSLLCTALPSFADTEAAALADKIRIKFHLNLGASVALERTDYPGIWALRTKQDSRYPAYIDENLDYTINFPDARGLVAQTPDGGSPEALAERRARLVAHIPLNKFIAIKGRTKFAAIVYSTPECPFCQKMEAYLTREGISYYVAPTSLSNAGIHWAETLFCSHNPAKAWRSAMTQHLEGDGKSCKTMPYQSAADMAYVFMVDGQHRPGVPAIVFADGTAVSGWNDERAKILQDKIRQGIFFR